MLRRSSDTFAADRVSIIQWRAIADLHWEEAAGHALEIQKARIHFGPLVSYLMIVTMAALLVADSADVAALAR